MPSFANNSHQLIATHSPILGSLDFPVCFRLWRSRDPLPYSPVHLRQRACLQHFLDVVLNRVSDVVLNRWPYRRELGVRMEYWTSSSAYLRGRLLWLTSTSSVASPFVTSLTKENYSQWFYKEFAWWGQSVSQTDLPTTEHDSSWIATCIDPLILSQQVTHSLVLHFAAATKVPPLSE